jgi:hypothetical protein
MNEVVAAIVSVATGGMLQGLVVLLVVAIILGVIAAIKGKTFTWGNFGKFVPDKVWPLVVWMCVAVLAQTSGTWDWLSATVYAGVIALYTKGILGSVKEITGFNIPERLSS